MKQRKTAYELSRSQVATPPETVALFWELVKKKRRHLNEVLDMGAGDCRFVQSEIFDRYVGIEIDPKRYRAVKNLPQNAELINQCAFKHQAENYDACIGNPPYVRHHDIESPWKENTVKKLEDGLGISLNKHCNLYLYFLCLGILKTHSKGIISMVIPFEWVSRPSAKSIREYIRKQKWNVEVYRFQEQIFDGVLTTASISIIDKGASDGKWEYFDITSKNAVVPRKAATKSNDGVMEYTNRGSTWALRGLSPGSQKIFALTEGERIRFGLTKKDVIPCITSLKSISRNLSILTAASFQKHFVDAGLRCWLIKSFTTPSPRLKAYLDSIPKEERDNYTCTNQEPWYNFKTHPVSQLLVASGFTKFGPKVLINSIGATSLGSVFGIHSERILPVKRVREYLLNLNLENRLVAHAGALKKIEVRQLNTVLKKMDAEFSNG